MERNGSHSGTPEGTVQPRPFVVGGERATQMKEVKHISFYYLTDERFTAL